MPKKFETRLYDETSRIKKENKMPYVTSWERIAKKKGEKKAYKAIAIKLLKAGVEKNIIADSTGFPINKIEELAAEAFQNKTLLNESEPAGL
ncbi:MAG: hypothetical protein GY859_12755 [Desulfobacterales bacterium]|nr:hypothetical protein [Desulfobacterales bacterium]